MHRFGAGVCLVGLTLAAQGGPGTGAARPAVLLLADRGQEAAAALRGGAWLLRYLGTAAPGDPIAYLAALEREGVDTSRLAVVGWGREASRRALRLCGRLGWAVRGLALVQPGPELQDQLFRWPQPALALVFTKPASPAWAGALLPVRERRLPVALVELPPGHSPGETLRQFLARVLVTAPPLLLPSVAGDADALTVHRLRRDAVRLRRGPITLVAFVVGECITLGLAGTEPFRGTIQVRLGPKTLRLRFDTTQALPRRVQAVVSPPPPRSLRARAGREEEAWWLHVFLDRAVWLRENRFPLHVVLTPEGAPPLRLPAAEAFHVRIVPAPRE